MADVKFTGLPAGSGIPDNGSLVAISTYDGVSAYTSEKYTMTQLKDIVYVMSPEDKISFDSSGTNKVFVEDSNSDITIQINNYGDNTYELNTKGVGDYTGGYQGIADTYSYWGVGAGSEGSVEFGANVDSQYLFMENATNRSNILQVINNISGSVNTNGFSITGNAFPVFLGGVNNSADISITNSVILGSSGINADKSGYVFSGKHEMQLATETFSFEDAGSVGATEQDWIEVSVGGVTGYIRVFATK
jgi:hypothetical protein